MRRSLFFTLVFVMACGGSNDVIGAARKPDPFITVRFRNLVDTTTAIGRANWHIFMDITSADPNQAGFVAVGNLSMDDRRSERFVHCQGVGADSVGQRLVAFLAVADTTTDQFTPQAPADSVARAWVAGNHTVPVGWMAFYEPPVDAWTSAQFLAGHGLVPSDPIKWGFDLVAPVGPTFYERTDSDVDCATF